MDFQVVGKAIRDKVDDLKVAIPAVVASATGALMTMGSGNYTAQYTPVTSAVALGSLADYVAFTLDVLTAVGNWFVQNPVGELLIGMSVVMFGMIMIKSFFRRGGKRK